FVLPGQTAVAAGMFPAPSMPAHSQAGAARHLARGFAETGRGRRCRWTLGPGRIRKMAKPGLAARPDTKNQEETEQTDAIRQERGPDRRDREAPSDPRPHLHGHR